MTISEPSYGINVRAQDAEVTGGTISQRTHAIEKQIETLSAAVSRLGERLGPVSNQTLGKGDVRASNPEPVVSPFAAHLGELHSRLVSLTDRVDELREQLEI